MKEPIWNGSDFRYDFELDLQYIPTVLILFACFTIFITYLFNSLHSPIRLDDTLQDNAIRRAEDQVIYEAASKDRQTYDQVLGVIDSASASKVPLLWLEGTIYFVTIIILVTKAAKLHSVPTAFIAVATCILVAARYLRRPDDYITIAAACTQYLFLLVLSLLMIRTGNYRLFDTLLATASASQVLLLFLRPMGNPQMRNKDEQAPPEIGYFSIIERTLFTTLSSVIYKAAKNETRGEAPMLRPDASAAIAMQEFRQIADRHPTWGLIRRLLWYLRYGFLRQLGYGTPAALIELGPPIFLRLILVNLSQPDSSSRKSREAAVIFAILMALSQLGRALIAAKVLLTGRQMCIKIRAVLSGEIYAKVLRRQDLDSQTKGAETSSAGKVANIISSDVFRLSEVFAYTHQLFPEGFIVLISGIVLLFYTLGTSATVALCVLLLQIPFQAALSKVYHSLSTKLLDATDARLHLMQEVVQAIRIVKFFAWEESFNTRLQILRDNEIKALSRRMLIDVTIKVQMLAGSILVAVTTFWFHAVWRKQPLDSTTAFTSLVLFNLIRNPLEEIAGLSVEVVRAFVSLNRIDRFLSEPDTAKWDILQTSDSDDQNKIGFAQATFDYGPSTDGEPHFLLENITCTFPIGKLSLVLGPVGSGKSTLLLSLLGETRKVDGSVFLRSSIFLDQYKRPSVAYCAQTPYLLSDTIRSNILFGADWDQVRYASVLKACALLPDLAQFDAGDATQVGERGTVLSGGQKARLALARALYSRAETILLDDVIAAVDAHTAQILLETLTGSLVQGRTVILVTHAVHIFLPACHHVVLLNDGMLTYSGAPEQAPLDLGETAVEVPRTAEEHPPEAHVASEIDQKLPTSPATNPVKASDSSRFEEQQETGAVSRAVYRFFLGSLGGWGTWSSIFALYIIGQAVELLSTGWLSKWVSATNLHRLSSSTFLYTSFSQNDDVNYYFTIYLILSLTAIAFHFLRTSWFLYRGIGSARKLYARLSASLIGATVKFYDVTPIGRIVNRLARDTNVLDQDIWNNASFLVWESVMTLAIFVAIAIAMPYFIPLAIPIAWFYTRLTLLYLRGSREFKRSESTSRSPVFSIFTESMTGIVTIRAFSDGSRFLHKLFTLQDTNSRPFYALWFSNRWVNLRTDFGSVLVTLIVALYVVLAPTVSAALAGFVLSYVLTFQGRLLWLARQVASLEIDANSVERVKEYIDLAQEDLTGLEPPASWPSPTASIVVEKLTARYALDMDPVLKEVSFRVEPKMKVAIVGRTGSGKSTLALTFFRFLESQTGSIRIDGIDIGQIKLRRLRQQLTIIAQDAVLFSGTIRFNLDPFGHHKDHELWDALRRVNMVTQTPGATPRPSRPPSRLGLAKLDDDIGKQSVTSSLEGSTERIVIKSLEQHVIEGGKNFSAGQRSLLALARGLLKLKTSRLLILDEASASLDAKTDELVQQTIRTEMQDATILCIAHRVFPSGAQIMKLIIASYDRVLVLSGGKVVEYDTPHNLLEKQDSAFSDLCRNTGEVEYARLKDLAQASHDRRN